MVEQSTQTNPVTIVEDTSQLLLQNLSLEKDYSGHQVGRPPKKTNVIGTVPKNKISKPPSHQKTGASVDIKKKINTNEMCTVPKIKIPKASSQKVSVPVDINEQIKTNVIVKVPKNKVPSEKPQHSPAIDIVNKTLNEKKVRSFEQLPLEEKELKCCFGFCQTSE